MDIAKVIKSNSGKTNLADSSSSADDNETEQDPDQDMMENTGPSVLNAPSIEQSYDPISFQNT